MLDALGAAGGRAELAVTLTEAESAPGCVLKSARSHAQAIAQIKHRTSSVAGPRPWRDNAEDSCRMVLEASMPMNRLNRVVTAGCFGIAGTFGVTGVSSLPALQEVALECNVKSNNDGCETTVSCPSGTKVKTAVVACNLEHGSVTDEQLSAVAKGYIQVVRPSDHVDEGSCWLGSHRVSSGQVAITDITTLTSVSLGCQEHDKNGGDCHIRGSMYCE
jgi:hypothetical protein